MSWLMRYISPSRVDNYVRYLSGVKYNFGDMPEYLTEEFIDSILGISAPSHHLYMGTAFHALFEHSKYGVQSNKVISQNITIAFSDRLYLKIYWPQCREIPVRGTIGNVTLKGTMDAIDCNGVFDLKTAKAFDYEYYSTSLQWQIYLMLSGKNKFTYYVFIANKDEENNSMLLTDFHSFDLYRYDGMGEYVTNIINDYYDVLQVLEPRILARIEEYNKSIDDYIERIKDNTIATAQTEINQLINKLKTKYLKGM